VLLIKSIECNTSNKIGSHSETKIKVYSQTLRFPKSEDPSACPCHNKRATKRATVGLAILHLVVHIHSITVITAIIIFVGCPYRSRAIYWVGPVRQSLGSHEQDLIIILLSSSSSRRESGQLAHNFQYESWKFHSS
jgi:hypothetical protein